MPPFIVETLRKQMVFGAKQNNLLYRISRYTILLFSGLSVLSNKVSENSSSGLPAVARSSSRNIINSLLTFFSHRFPGQITPFLILHERSPCSSSRFNESIRVRSEERN